MKLKRLPLFAFLLLVPGCWDEGGLANQEYPGQALATISGTIRNSTDIQVSDQVSIAIWWYNVHDVTTTEMSGVEQEYLDQMFPENPSSTDEMFLPLDPPPWELPCDGLLWEGLLQNFRASQRLISQSVDYQASFPIQFEASLFQLPPDSAMCDLASYGGEGAAAIGGVIAYLDENGNDRYDFGTALNAPELALASSELPADPRETFSVFLLTYVDGEGQGQTEACRGVWFDFLPDSASLEDGFSILEIRFDLEGAVIERIVRDIDTPFDLEMSEIHQDRFCNETAFQIRWREEPPDPDLVWCHVGPNGRAYVRIVDIEDVNPCLDGWDIWGACLPDDMQAPDDWPCP